METLYLGVACFLLLTMLVGLWRVFLGPHREDRLVAVQLFGTTGVAMLLLLAEVYATPSIRDAALLFALLAVLAVVAFLRSPGGTTQDEE